jgi:putative tryptophan/tyrosine transport system substrate-binding protein
MPDQTPSLVAELVQLKVDVLVSGASPAIVAAKHATKSIPIVMVISRDPVATGLVDSLARPGGNITGLTLLSRDLSGKRLELLKEIIPKLSRVAVFGTSSDAGNAQDLSEVELAAGVLGVKLQYQDVLGPKDVESAFRAAGQARVDACLCGCRDRWPIFSVKRLRNSR